AGGGGGGGPRAAGLGGGGGGGCAPPHTPLRRDSRRAEWSQSPPGFCATNATAHRAVRQVGLGPHAPAFRIGGVGRCVSPHKPFRRDSTRAECSKTRRALAQRTPPHTKPSGKWGWGPTRQPSGLGVWGAALAPHNKPVSRGRIELP